MKNHNKNKIIGISMVFITISILYTLYTITVGINLSPKKETLYKGVETVGIFSKELYKEKFEENKKNEEMAKTEEKDYEIITKVLEDDVWEDKYKDIQGVKIPIYTHEESNVMEGDLEGFVFKEEDYYKENVVNINIADKKELLTLEGVDEKLADNIVAYREAYGGFLFAREVKEVHGMTEEIFEKNKEIITVSKIPKPKEKEN